MSSSRYPETQRRDARPERPPSRGTRRSRARGPSAARGSSVAGGSSAASCLAALAILLSSVACASRDAGPSPSELALSMPTPELRETIASDKTRLEEMISIPDEEFETSFTQNPELNEIAARLPAFQSALRERESALDEKAPR